MLNHTYLVLVNFRGLKASNLPPFLREAQENLVYGLWAWLDGERGLMRGATNRQFFDSLVEKRKSP